MKRKRFQWRRLDDGLRRGACCTLSLALVACTGALDDPSSPAASEVPGGAGAAPGSGGTGTPGAATVGTSQPPETRLWRIAPDQYLTVLRRTLDESVELPNLPVEGRFEGFPNNDSKIVTEGYFALLEQHVPLLVGEHRSALEERLPCSVEDLDRACLGELLDDLVPLAQRRSQYDRDLYLDLFTALRSELGPGEALEGVVTAVLLSPKTLHRTELGPPVDSAPGEAVSLSDDELAEALAFTLWNGLPDAELMQLARDGRLSDPAEYEAQVERMLADARSAGGLKALVLNWLGLTTERNLHRLDKAEEFTDWQEGLRREMWAEVDGALDQLLAEDRLTLPELLTTRGGPVGPELAELYGISAAGPAALPRERTGLLTRAGVVASNSYEATTGIVYRGKALLSRLFCLELEVPPGVNMDEAGGMEGMGPTLTMPRTSRQRLEGLQEIEPCAGCHQYLHPFAFTMEPYDPIGRLRETEEGLPIDPSGVVTGLLAEPLTFRDAPELFEELAERQEPRACFARQAFRYTFGRHEVRGDQALINGLAAEFVTTPDVRQLMRAFVLSPRFHTRQRSEG